MSSASHSIAIAEWEKAEYVALKRLNVKVKSIINSMMCYGDFPAMESRLRLCSSDFFSCLLSHGTFSGVSTGFVCFRYCFHKVSPFRSEAVCSAILLSLWWSTGRKRHETKLVTSGEWVHVCCQLPAQSIHTRPLMGENDYSGGAKKVMKTFLHCVWSPKEYVKGSSAHTQDTSSHRIASLRRKHSFPLLFSHIS